MTRTLVDEPCAAWTTIDDLPACGCKLEDELDATIETGLSVAASWLYRLSGRQFPGACTTTFRPVPACGCWPPDASGWALLDTRTGALRPTGGRHNEWWFGRRREFALEIDLGYEPVRAVSQVKIDGAVLAPSAYRLDDDRYLVRIDGSAWPATNDFSRADTELGTWSISLSYGSDPPPDGKVAAGVLGVEVAKALCGKDCALPARATSMARQGVTLTILDPTDLLDNGQFGILVVDAFLATVNPHHLQGDAAVLNVDAWRTGRRTGTSFSSS